MSRGRFDCLTFVLAVGLLVPPPEALASGQLKWLGRGAVIGGGFEVAHLLNEAAILISAVAAQRCVTSGCMTDLAAFVHGHPHLGMDALNREFGVYKQRHPAEAAVITQIQIALSERLKSDFSGRPVPRNGVPEAPGDCSEGQQQKLQQDVNEYCKAGSQGCRMTDSADVLQAKLSQNKMCVTARNRINETCFRGGDFGHRIALDMAINAVTGCEEVIAKSP